MMGRGSRWAARVVALAALVGAPLTVAAVTAEPAAAAVQVSTPSDLFTAWPTATSIQVMNDITVQPADCAAFGPGGGGPTRSATNGDVVLDGQGHTLTMNCTGQTQGPSMLRATSSDSVTLQNVTITGGTDGSDSGGVCKEGPGNLTLNAVTMTGNHNNGGGAVCFGQNGGGGTLTVNKSTLTNNSTCSNGGAIEVQGNSNAVITNSTIANNQTNNDGGALAHSGSGNVSVTNSTITGNTAAKVGGLEVDSGNLTLVYVTDVNNTTESSLAFCNLSESTRTIDPGADSAPEPPDSHGAVGAKAAGDSGANVRVSQPANNLTTFGSVIAQPQGGPNCSGFGAAPQPPLTNTVSNGWNFADDTSCGLTGTGDKQAAGNNPQLGPLASNGGPTQTLLPQTGSPLIDGVPLASCQADGAAGIAIDQRFLTRPSGAGCDIGAVEIQVAAVLVIQPKFTG